MRERVRILLLSSNPWTTSRILVDEETREIFEKLQEGQDRDKFELHKHAAIRPTDLQRLLMTHKPHIIHFSGHGTKKHKIMLGGKPGRGKQVDRDGLVKVLALYKNHVRLVVLNACFTETQARSLSEVIDYSVGTAKGIGDKESVAFAGAFYRALGFGKSVKAAFESAKAELALTRMPRTKGLGLFVRKGLDENDSFPKADKRLNIEEQDRYTNRSDAGALPEKEVFKRSSLEIPLFKVLAPDSSECFCHEERQGCGPDLPLLSAMRMVTNAPALEHKRLSDRLAHTTRGSVRKTKSAWRTDALPIQVDIKRQSSLGCSRSYATVTVKVFKVAISESNCISHMQLPRKDQSVLRRATGGKGKLARGKRS